MAYVLIILLSSCTQRIFLRAIFLYSLLDYSSETNSSYTSKQHHIYGIGASCERSKEEVWSHGVGRQTAEIQMFWAGSDFVLLFLYGSMWLYARAWLQTFLKGGYLKKHQVAVYSYIWWCSDYSIERSAAHMLQKPMERWQLSTTFISL